MAEQQIECSMHVDLHVDNTMKEEDEATATADSIILKMTMTLGTATT